MSMSSISTSLDFTKELQNCIEVGDGVEEFSNAVSQQLLRGKMSVSESELCIGDNTWDMRFTKMLACI